jgi:hypothetical protein
MKRWRWLFVFLALWSLTALACALTGEGDRSTTADSPAADTAVRDAAAGEAGTAVDDHGAAGELLELSELKRALDFDSYRYAFELRFEQTGADGAPEQNTISGSTLFTADPPATRTDITITGAQAPDTATAFSMVTIGNAQYMALPGFGCISGADALGAAALQTVPFSELADPANMLNLARSARRVLPDETINGVLSRHYTFDETAFDAGEANLEQAEGHLYVAAEAGYVTRYVLEGIGRTPFTDALGDQPGKLRLQFDLLDVNQPLEITPPAECDAAGIAEDGLPLLPDASEITRFAGMLTYRSQTSLAEAQAFYIDALTQAGWTAVEADSFTAEETAVLAFARNQESLTLTLNVDGDGLNVLLIASHVER